MLQFWQRNVLLMSWREVFMPWCIEEEFYRQIGCTLLYYRGRGVERFAVEQNIINANGINLPGIINLPKWRSLFINRAI